MHHIIHIIARRIAVSAIRASWAIMDTAARRQALGERLEAWANRWAVRYGCVDDVIATVTSDALSAR